MQRGRHTVHGEKELLCSGTSVAYASGVVNTNENFLLLLSASQAGLEDKYNEQEESKLNSG